MKIFAVLILGISAILFASILSFALLEYLTVENYVEASVLRISGNSIIIGNNCTAIIAETSPERAASIELGLEKRMDQRPNTHDTFAQALKSFNVTLESVRLERYDNRYYYSDMILRTKDKMLLLDAMPSDAIALALRMGAPIYVNKTLLQEVGKNIC